jgi:hypothetical protein
MSTEQVLQTPAESLFSALEAKAKTLGRKLTREEWLEVTGSWIFADRIEQAEKRRKPKTPKGGPRARDVIFDAICTACGIYVNGITRGQAGRVVACKRDIEEACPVLSAEELAAEIARRADKYRKKYPTTPCTPTALSNHWGEFGGGPTRAAKLDPYQEPDGWRSVACSLFPDAKSWANPVDFWTVKWAEVSINIRPQISRACQGATP